MPALTAREEKIPILLVEPSFLHASLQQKIAGAERTVIVPAWLIKKNNGEATVALLEPGYQTLSEKKMHHFVEQARSNLSAELAKLAPKFLRDEHGVIQVALLESPQPVTASTILAPDFAAHFTRIFGPDLLIAIPSSNRVYIFSKLLPPMNSIAPEIRDDYKLSVTPISTEFFELSHGQLRALGSFD
ncbi:MAG: hypothetical protein K2W97_04475 [Chthoniobacterales bacterium]|nr:hypothetical protein [Chthoniobacterales bacterium]